MCGIVCIINKKNARVEPALVERANRAIHHRGPDEQATYFFENVALGITRLSIVDVVGGHQPLFNEDKSCVLVYNGEIYNHEQLRHDLVTKGHTFATRSDGEVILHLYEESLDYVAQLDGMFSYVLIDLRNRLAHIARDRLGIKPLFQFANDEWLIFSSEIKGIFATGLCPRALDNEGVWDSFTFNYIPGRSTAFQMIKQFPSAELHVVDLTTAQSTVREYWQFSFPSKQATNSIKIAPYAEQLRETLSQSVGTHILGDVEVAAYLSGGVDSTVTSILLKQLYQSHEPIKTFSILFADKRFDESEIINKTNELLGFKPFQLTSDEIDSKLFAKALYHLEQPQGSPLDVPLCSLAETVQQAGIKVVLSGEGSDEIFGGYFLFMLNQVRRALSIPLLAGVRDIVLAQVLRYFIISEEDRGYFLSLYTGDSSKIISRFGIFPPWFPIWHRSNTTKRDFFLRPERDSLGEDAPIAELCLPLKSRYRGIDDFNKSIYLECKTRLPNYILTRVDRNSMAHSVEARVPFLSNKMVDLSCRIPPFSKMLGLREKYILRQAFKAILPPHVRRRTKFAYNAPAQSLWRKRDLLRDEVMSPEALTKVGIFSHQKIAQLQQELASSSISSSRREDLETHLTRVLSVQLLHETLIEQRV